jgi:hypothetical protein
MAATLAFRAARSVDAWRLPSLPRGGAPARKRSTDTLKDIDERDGLGHSNNMNSAASLQVAETILQQLGGARMLGMMCGCKDFGGTENSVQFKIGSNEKKVTLCRIVLDPSDTYTVEFYAGRGLKIRKVWEMSDVYADSLMDIFEAQTGMYLTFRKRA